MTISPKKKNRKNKKIRFFSGLMENNKFIFLLSLLIAFIVWVTVAMYKSPEESFTVYNVPVTIATENSIISQKGYVNFWQSDEKIDVTVTGPRYMVTALTAEDILVSASLNAVDSAGISELPLKVSLRDGNADITISSMSKTAVEVYFDAEMKKEFNIKIDDTAVADHIAEGYECSATALTVSTVELKGPETEINKIENVVATPQLPEESLYKTASIPVTLSLEGATAADTVSVNKYVGFVDDLEYFVNIGVNKIMQLAPKVEFARTEKTGVTASFDVEAINVKCDTLKEDFTDETLTVLKVDYSSLKAGVNKFTVDVASIPLPDGMTITDGTEKINVTITVPAQ